MLTKLETAKAKAIKQGWTPNFVEEVANLDHGIHSLERLRRKTTANYKQIIAIVEVYRAAQGELLKAYKQSQG